MRVLLDECIDWRFAREIVGHEVRTVEEMGWASIKNGALLTLASQHFDVFVTVDRNLPHQQNISTFSVAVIVLRAKTNRLTDLKLLAPDVLAAIGEATPGSLTTCALLG